MDGIRLLDPVSLKETRWDDEEHRLRMAAQLAAITQRPREKVDRTSWIDVLQAFSFFLVVVVTIVAYNRIMQRMDGLRTEIVELREQQREVGCELPRLQRKIDLAAGAHRRIDELQRLAGEGWGACLKRLVPFGR